MFCGIASCVQRSQRGFDMAFRPDSVSGGQSSYFNHQRQMKTFASSSGLGFDSFNGGPILLCSNNPTNNPSCVYKLVYRGMVRGADGAVKVKVKVKIKVKVNTH